MKMKVWARVGCNFMIDCENTEEAIKEALEKEVVKIPYAGNNHYIPNPEESVKDSDGGYVLENSCDDLEFVGQGNGHTNVPVFPNGFTDFLEAYHEIATSIYLLIDKETPGVALEEHYDGGSGRMWELAQEWAMEFEKLFKNAIWGDDLVSEFYDLIDAYIALKNRGVDFTLVYGKCEKGLWHFMSTLYNGSKFRFSVDATDCGDYKEEDYARIKAVLEVMKQDLDDGVISTLVQQLT